VNSCERDAAWRERQECLDGSRSHGIVRLQGAGSSRFRQIPAASSREGKVTDQDLIGRCGLFAATRDSAEQSGGGDWPVRHGKLREEEIGMLRDVMEDMTSASPRATGARVSSYLEQDQRFVVAKGLVSEWTSPRRRKVRLLWLTARAPRLRELGVDVPARARGGLSRILEGTRR